MAWKWLTTFEQYLPAILIGVIGVEQAINAPGATKKQIVLDSIVSAGAALSTTPNTNVSEIGKLIDAVVGALNTAGIFQHGTPVSGVPVIPAPSAPSPAP